MIKVINEKIKAILTDYEFKIYSPINYDYKGKYEGKKANIVISKREDKWLIHSSSLSLLHNILLNINVNAMIYDKTKDILYDTLVIDNKIFTHQRYDTSDIITELQCRYVAILDTKYYIQHSIIYHTVKSKFPQSHIEIFRDRNGLYVCKVFYEMMHLVTIVFDDTPQYQSSVIFTPSDMLNEILMEIKEELC